MNAISQNRVLTANVVWDTDRANLIVSQIHNFLAPNTNNVVMRFGHWVITNTLMNRSQT